MTDQQTSFVPLLDKKNYSKMFKRRFEMKKAVIYSAVFHLILVIVFSITNSEEIKTVEKRVLLILNRRVVSEEITRIDTSDRARNNDQSDSLQDDNSKTDKIDKNEKSILDKYMPLDNKRKRKNTHSKDLSRLSRDDPFKHGKKKSLDSKKWDEFLGKRSSDRDNKTKDGSAHRLGRDDISKTSDGKKRLKRDAGRLSRKGRKGRGVTGVVSIKGRKVIFRPYVSLPEKYNRLGLSFKVSVRVTFNRGGIARMPKIQKSSGYTELDRILCQYARRYRVQPSSWKNQTGIVIFNIHPK